MSCEGLLEESQKPYTGRNAQRMLVYGAERGPGCRTSVKAEVPSVERTDYDGLCPQLIDLQLTQSGKCGVDRKACR